MTKRRGKRPLAWERGGDGVVRCACCGEQCRRVLVTVPAGLSGTGKDKRVYRGIDACLAPIVRALNRHGIRTDGCCCGHGSGMGDIFLHDGRILVVLPSREAYTAVRGTALRTGRLKPRQH